MTQPRHADWSDGCVDFHYEVVVRTRTLMSARHDPDRARDADFANLSSAFVKLLEQAMDEASLVETLRDLPNDKSASIKVGHDSGPGSIARFTRAQPVEHYDVSNVDRDYVRVYERETFISIDGNVWAFTLRAFAPTTLKKELRRLSQRPRPLTRAKGSVRALISGVGSLHRNDIVHGNVRPSRVIYENDRWVVADYLPSSSLLHSVDYLKSSDTKYLAPELLSGARLVPNRSTDQFAVGVVLADISSELSWTQLLQDRDFWNRVKAVSRVLTSEDPNFRVDLRWAADCLERRDTGMLGAIRDRDTALRIRSKVSQEFRSNHDTHRSLKSSEPLQVAIGQAMEVLDRSAKRNPGLLLQLQSSQYYAIMVDRLTFTILQSRGLTEKVLERQLHIDERNLNVTRRIHPPDIDDEWRDEIWDDYRKLLIDPEISFAGDDAERLARYDKYAYDSREVLERLKTALSTAAELRTHLLDALPYLTERDLLGELDASLAVGDTDPVEALLMAGALVAVKDHQVRYYPEFQFVRSDNGLVPAPVIAWVNAELGDLGRGWSTVLWWTSENDVLGGRTPASLLGTGADNEIVAAARDLQQL